MGRELVIKRIKSRDMKLIVFTLITGLLIGLFGVVMFLGEVPEGGIIMTVFASIMFLLSFIWIYRYANPMKDRCFKKNPRLLEQADELFADIVHKDAFIICSHRIIANAKDITQMAALDEITDVCENTYSYNCIRTSHYIILTLPNYIVTINVYAKNKETIKKLKYNIIQHCPKVLEKQFKFGAKID